MKHMHKDLRLMLEQGTEAKVALPVTQAIERLFADSEASGKSDLDYSAILAQLEEGSGVKEGSGA